MCTSVHMTARTAAGSRGERAVARHLDTPRRGSAGETAAGDLLRDPRAEDESPAGEPGEPARDRRARDGGGDAPAAGGRAATAARRAADRLRDRRRRTGGDAHGRGWSGSVGEGPAEGGRDRHARAPDL